ncbi:MAG: class I SAM-dependent methyltransferase [Candidatus Wolfebacteria bacterium]|nr:class I SAM-dependent methyltransferase [Candidatus Wolfebacteria bacterium]
MKSSEYKLMEENQFNNWWYLGRRKILEKLLCKYLLSNQKIVIADAGSGFGGNIPMALKYGEVVALEMDEGATEYLKKRFGDSITFIRWKSPDKIDRKFDLVIITDVLEHIEDDRQAVSWIYDHLKRGGHVLVTVPAHQFLWSQMDVLTEHFRKYGRKELLGLFKDKFSARKISYYNFFLFPAKVAIVIFSLILASIFPNKEKKSYNGTPPALINGIFKRILYLEAILINSLSFPWGGKLGGCFSKKLI